MRSVIFNWILWSEAPSETQVPLPNGMASLATSVQRKPLIGSGEAFGSEEWGQMGSEKVWSQKLVATFFIPLGLSSCRTPACHHLALVCPTVRWTKPLIAKALFVKWVNVQPDLRLRVWPRQCVFDTRWRERCSARECPMSTKIAKKSRRGLSKMRAGRQRVGHANLKTETSDNISWIDVYCISHVEDILILKPNLTEQQFILVLHNKSLTSRSLDYCLPNRSMDEATHS